MNTEQVNSIDLRAQDFIASEAYKSAPLGGMNEFSVDTSVIVNAPNGPDGKPMVFFWFYPQSLPEKERQGIQKVPPDAFRRSIKGGPPLKATSASVDYNGDAVYRDSKMVMLGWTTWSNYQRLQQNNAEAAERAKGGLGAFQKTLEADNEFAKRNGFTGQYQEAFRPISESDSVEMATGGGSKAPKLTFGKS